MRVIVLGANGKLGREVVRHVTARGHEVTAFVRRSPVPPFESAVRSHLGDARNPEDLRTALVGHAVVVNAIGSGMLRRNDVESSTTKAAVAAAENVPVKRYFAMSAGMVAVKAFFFMHIIRPLIFRNLHAEHLRVEALVRASSLEWTIVRPPRLTSRSAEGFIPALEFSLGPGSYSMSRADVAAFIAEEIDNNAYIHKAVFLKSALNRKQS